MSVTNRVPLNVPSIVLPELAAALSRGHGGAEFATEMVRELLELTTLKIHPVSLRLATSAAEMAGKLGIRGCDAIYVALAAELGDVLVSFDRQQLDRASSAVTVLRPE